MLERYLPKEKKGHHGKNGYECMVRLLGPRLLTAQGDKFFVVQVGESGTPYVSVPLTKENAYRSANSARGVKSFVCQVVDTVDTTAK